MGFQHNSEIASKAGKKSKRGENKITSDVKAMIIKLVEDNFEDIMEDMGYLESKDKVKAWLDLVNYILPKQRSVESQSNVYSITAEEVEKLVNKIITDRQ